MTDCVVFCAVPLVQLVPVTVGNPGSLVSVKLESAFAKQVNVVLVPLCVVIVHPAASASQTPSSDARVKARKNLLILTPHNRRGAEQHMPRGNHREPDKSLADLSCGLPLPPLTTA